MNWRTFPTCESTFSIILICLHLAGNYYVDGGGSDKDKVKMLVAQYAVHRAERTPWQ